MEIAHTQFQRYTIFQYLLRRNKNLIIIENLGRCYSLPAIKLY